MSARQYRIRGLVQGVGFRPYVWRLANALGLRGWVRNDGAGVSLAVDGQNVAEFLHRLPLEKPPLARIDAIECVEGEVVLDSTGFVILDSVAGTVTTAIGPDAALCPDCLADLCDPASRRWRYAFTTCTHCGPRYTVSRQLPYDRAHTSLSPFPLCPPCAAEYTDPADRRYHAETTACPRCGPRLQLKAAVDAENWADFDGDPLAETVRRLRAGQIVAIKGLGGFHLACDARNAAAVAELRQRKQRDAKPLAVMGLNAASLAAVAEIGPGEAACLQAVAAPIVLCPKGKLDLPGIAPGLAWIGTMLPATPLHLLLWHESAGRPVGTDWLAAEHDLLLVMTSANPHGEPLVIDNAEAALRLAGLADALLLHDRDILIRCDDSVVRPAPGGPAFVRRARGYVPVPIPLAKGGPTVLALGGYLKNTVCVLKGREAFLSQHIGGLDNAAAVGFLEETVAHLLAILDVQPDLIAHDLHPDFPSTRLAQAWAAARGIPAIAVGHHQAHLAAICAEQGLKMPVIGLALDGVGLGPDGGAWGGELLRLDGDQASRLGHLWPLALPGGDRAAREPWRMALSALHACGLAPTVDAWQRRVFPDQPLETQALLGLLERGLRCPPSSSLGRWFDAVAGLLGVQAVSQYEGQAAMRLEGLAAGHGPVPPRADGWRIQDGVLDLRPLVPVLLAETDAGRGAAMFHATLAAALADWLRATVNPEKEAHILVGGGCAMNAVLMAALAAHLGAAGWRLVTARQAPPNDGGLALGQAWVARQVFKERKNVSGDSRTGG